MESLCWSYGFRVLVKENCFNPCKNALFSNLGAPPICFNYQCSESRTSRSSVVHSTESDLAHIEDPTAKQVLIPLPSTASQPFPRLRLENDHLWSALELAEAVDGEIIRWGPLGTISTDTRKLMPGQWFFAIAGKNFDGHDFVNKELAAKGCVGVIGNRVCKNWHGGFIKVEGDTMFALEKMAKFARNRFHGIVVGLTGSVGKTTTRTMIALALESLGLVYQTHGNLNYMVGVALTLMGIPMDAKASVVELGMGGKEGEILEMARMCRPSVRVILNVGHGHMEHFRSLKEVAKAKGEILAEAKPGNICVLNADDPLVMSIPVPLGVKKVLFGRKRGCDVRLVLAENIYGGCAVRVVLERKMETYHNLFSFPGEKTLEMVEFKIHGPGLHLAMDACAAAAVAVSLGVPLPQIGEALSRFRPVHMRSEIEIARNGIKIINDTYNANLASMLAAIKSLKSMDCEGKRVSILGDMLELGAAEAGAHELVLKLCFDACIALVMLAGKRFTAAAENLNFLGSPNIICAPDSSSLVPRIAEMLTAGDVVLVKGSRVMQMEKVVDAIKVIGGW